MFFPWLCVITMKKAIGAHLNRAGGPPGYGQRTSARPGPAARMLPKSDTYCGGSIPTSSISGAIPGFCGGFHFKWWITSCSRPKDMQGTTFRAHRPETMAGRL